MIEEDLKENQAVSKRKKSEHELESPNEAKDSETKKTHNEYSIYDYLKSTPSVLIALISAFVAIATFVSKIAAANSMKTVLLFWQFDLSYLNYSDSSLLFTALMSFLFFVFMSFVNMCDQACQSFLIPCKADIYKNKLLYKIINKEIGESKEKAELIDHLKRVIKKLTTYYRKLWLFSSSFTVVLLFFALLLYMSVFSKSTGWAFWRSILVFLLIQLVVLKAVETFINSKDYSRRKIRDKYKLLKPGSIESSVINCTEEKHPIFRFHFEGIRPFFSNSAMLMCLILIVINCVFACVSPNISMKQFSWQKDTYRITYFEDKTYVIIMQDNDRYFLERAEICTLEKSDYHAKTGSTDKNEDDESENDDVPSKTVLNVFVNEQRVIQLSDITYMQRTFDDVVKIESGEIKK